MVLLAKHCAKRCCLHNAGTSRFVAKLGICPQKMNRTIVEEEIAVRTLRLLLSVILVAVAAQTAAAQRPNVLWITLEDTSTQFIGAYGNLHVKTPAIDDLAANGVRFNRAFASAPVCSAARSAIITGICNEVLGTGHHRSKYPIPKDIKGFPSFLRNAGYYTSNNAKTDYNTSEEPRLKKESWDACSTKAGWWGRKDGQPFFSVFNIADCHQSRTMTWPWQQYEKKVLNKLNETDLVAPDELEMPAFYHDSPEMRTQMTRVYNSIKLADNSVAEIIARLEKDGLREDTIIFMYADHGEGLPNMKGGSIAMSYRVPFVIWFPEKYQHLNPWGKQVVTEELVCFEDLAPTLLSIAGVEIPEYMTGRPLLGEARSEAPEFVFASRNRCGEGADLVRTVTDGEFLYSRVFLPHYPPVKYHMYFDVGDISKTMRSDYAANRLSTVQRQLFEPRSTEYLVDIRNDRWEVNNLARDPAHSERLERMRRAAFERIDNVSDVHFLPEYEMDRIVRSGGTILEAFKDSKKYPLKRIVEAARLVGQGEQVAARQLELLNDQSPFVRYWAAVGINAQAEDVFDHKSLILKAMEDSYPCVQIEMASLACKLYRDADAKRVMESHLGGDDLYLVWQSLQAIVYLDHEEAADLIPLVDRLKKRIEGKKNHPLNQSLVTSSIKVIDYKFRGAELKY